ncbi:hypothetical protein ONZ45_g294 [Pleurotus djamor]|nr:hypothetical protein ONZ45_g294 [Pleurotus djamor]
MGQVYQIINIDKRETTGDLGKLGQFKHDRGVNEFLTARYIIPYKMLPTRKYKLFSKPGDEDLGVFHALPVEVVNSIAKYLPTDSLIMLAITNSQLFAAVYLTLMRRLLAYYSTWESGRIICLGDYTDEIPAGCISKDEERDLVRKLPPNARYNQESAFSLYHLANTCFMHKTRESFNEGKRYWELSFTERRQYQATVTLFATPRSGDKVFVNAARKEYIKHVEGVEFKVVVIPLTLWGGHDGTEAGFDKHGPWAGHRLAIVSEDEFSAQTLKHAHQWVDITEEAIHLQAKFLRLINK